MGGTVEQGRRQRRGVAGGHQHGAPVPQPQGQAGTPAGQRPAAAEDRRPGVDTRGAVADGAQVGDVDRDGRPDIVMAQGTGASVSVMLSR